MQPPKQSLIPQSAFSSLRNSAIGNLNADSTFNSNTSKQFSLRSSFRNRPKDLRDNRFAGAKLVATLAPGYGSKSLILSGKVNQEDAADYFRISLLPGASISSTIDSQRLRGGALTFSAFVEINGFRKQAYKEVAFRRQTSPEFEAVNPPLINNFSQPIVLYFKAEALGGKESRYWFNFSLFQ